MIVTRTSLIHRVRNKDDQDSWKEFFQLYHPLVRSYVRKKGVPPSKAEDVVADVFTRLVKYLPEFTLDHSKGRFRTWLWRVTMSAIGQGGRDEPLEKPMAILPDPPAKGEEEDPDWINEYRRGVLAKVFPRVQAQTQDKTWACFVEFVVKNRKAKDIAPEVGLTSNAVCVNANRVLTKVRELCLEEYDEDLDDA